MTQVESEKMANSVGRVLILCAIGAGLGLLTAHEVRAEINENQVLVLYNSQGPDADGNGFADSQDIYNYYKSYRPGVLGFDLNNSTISPGNISYNDYILKIRSPLRSHLSTNNLQRQVISFVLTKDLPHRIQDTGTGPGLGDNPALALDAFNNGRATYASVDSELSLLWQPLEAGEAGGTMDSKSDNMILNPYHNVMTSIGSFSRTLITGTKQYENLGNAAWRLLQNGSPANAGNIYLPVRLDGNTVDDVFGMIDRAQMPSYNQFVDQLIFDENATRDFDNSPLFTGSSIGYLGDDYDDTVAQLSPKYDAVMYDQTSVFYIGEGPGYTGVTPGTVVNGEVAALVSFGGNHGRAEDGLSEFGFVESFAGQYAAGAIMNTAESFNAKQFGGLGGFSDQGQLSAFIAAGGTFGVGSAWEPFSFALPDNEVLLEAFLFRGQTWAEAAWASVPWLSWQQVVVGDPLAKATLILDPKTVLWRGNAPNSGLSGDGASWSSFANWQRDGIQDSAMVAGDTVVLAAGSTQALINLQGNRIVEQLTFQAAYQLNGGRLMVRNGNVAVDQNVTAISNVPIFTTRGLTKVGPGTLVVNARTDQTTVAEGTLAGTGPIRGVVVASGARLTPGPISAAGVLDVQGDLTLNSGAILTIDWDGRTLTHDTLEIEGTAALSGQLEINLANGFLEQAPRGIVTTSPLLSAASVTGTFDALWLDGEPLQPVDVVSAAADTTMWQHAISGLFQRLSYAENEVSLESYLAIPGDANGDYVVDDLDLAIWSVHQFQSDTDWLQGDFNSDGVTDVRDFNLWRSNYGRSATIQQPAIVPEPAMWTLGMLLSFLVIPALRRRKI
jgi:hypothetical protein